MKEDRDWADENRNSPIVSYATCTTIKNKHDVVYQIEL